jgi:hypothetical protein
MGAVYARMESRAAWLKTHYMDPILEDSLVVPGAFNATLDIYPLAAQAQHSSRQKHRPERQHRPRLAAVAEASAGVKLIEA